MKKIVPALLLLFIYASTFAQTTNDIIGEWQFIAIKTDEGVTATKKSAAESFLNGMAYNFNADNTYTGTALGMAEKGNWKLHGKIVDLTTDMDKKYFIEILQFSKDMLTIQLKSMKLIFARAGSEAAKDPAIAIRKASYVTATKAQLSQKWYLTGKTASENLSQTQKEVLAEQLAGSYLNLNTNGKYISDNSGTIENGSWSLTENNKAIATKKGSYIKLWHIVKITATDLTLYLDGTNEEWTFTNQE